MDHNSEFGFVTMEKPHTLRSFAAYADWMKSLHFSDPPPKVWSPLPAPINPFNADTEFAVTGACITVIYVRGSAQLITATVLNLRTLCGWAPIRSWRISFSQ